MNSGEHCQRMSDVSSNVPSCSRNNIRSVHRILDPPDVSLSSISSTNQPNTLDLCSTLRSNSKFAFNIMKNGSNVTASHANISSPSSNGSSTSSSSAATNLSGLIMSNSNSSTASPSHTQMLSDICNNQPSTSTDVTSFVDLSNPTPSTSTGFNTSLTINNRLAELEREVRNLQMQKSILQQQILQRDNQITSLQRTIFETPSTSSPQTTSNTIEPNLIQRINESFERLETSISTSMMSLENRIVHLENRFKSKCYNGTIMNDTMELQATTTSHDNHIAQSLLDEMKKVNLSIWIPKKT